jgi:hypothetical protein
VANPRLMNPPRRSCSLSSSSLSQTVLASWPTTLAEWIPRNGLSSGPTRIPRRDLRQWILRSADLERSAVWEAWKRALRNCRRMTGRHSAAVRIHQKINLDISPPSLPALNIDLLSPQTRTTASLPFLNGTRLPFENRHQQSNRDHQSRTCSVTGTSRPWTRQNRTSHHWYTTATTLLLNHLPRSLLANRRSLGDFLAVRSDTATTVPDTMMGCR